MRTEGRFLHVLLVSVLTVALPLRSHCRHAARQSRASSLAAIEDALHKSGNRARQQPPCQQHRPATKRGLKNVVKELLSSGTPPYAIIDLVVDALKFDERADEDTFPYPYLEDSRDNIALPLWLNRLATNQKREGQVDDRSRAGSDVTNPWFEVAREESPLYDSGVRPNQVVEEVEEEEEEEEELEEEIIEELGAFLADAEIEALREEEQRPLYTSLNPHQIPPPVSSPINHGSPPRISPARPHSPGIPPRFPQGNPRGNPQRIPPEMNPTGGARPRVFPQGSRGQGPPANLGPPVLQMNSPGNLPFPNNSPPGQPQQTFHVQSTHSQSGPDSVEVPPSGVEVVIRAQSLDEAYTTRISLSPMMSVYDALYQAGIEYDSQSNGHNPFDFGIGTLDAEQCYIVNSMGGLSRNDEYHWVITVADEHGKVLWNNVCLPDPSDLLRNGFTIQLDYVSRAVAPSVVRLRPVVQEEGTPPAPPAGVADASADTVHPKNSSASVDFSPCSHHAMVSSATGHLRLDPILSGILQFLFCHHYNATKKT